MPHVLNVVFSPDQERVGGTVLGSAAVKERGKPTVLGRIEEVTPERLRELDARPGAKKSIVYTNRGIAWRYEVDPNAQPVVVSTGGNGVSSGVAGSGSLGGGR